MSLSQRDFDFAARNEEASFVIGRLADPCHRAPNVSEAEKATPPDAIFQMPINNKTKDILTIAENVLGAQLANVRQTVLDRAAVALDEDFRSGLDSWISRGNATAGFLSISVG